MPPKAKRLGKILKRAEKDKRKMAPYSAKAPNGKKMVIIGCYALLEQEADDRMSKAPDNTARLKVQAATGVMKIKPEVDGAIGVYSTYLRHPQLGEPQSAAHILHVLDKLVRGGKGNDNGMMGFFARVEDGDTVESIARRHLDYIADLKNNPPHPQLAETLPLLAQQFARGVEDGIPGLREAKLKLLAERGTSR